MAAYRSHLGPIPAPRHSGSPDLDSAGSPKKGAKAPAGSFHVIYTQLELLASPYLRPSRPPSRLFPAKPQPTILPTGPHGIAWDPMAPLLLDLPPEVLHIILYHSALSRRLKRALRLRLVCKTFAVLLYLALFETEGLLDKGPPGRIGTLDCQLLLQNGGETVWHEYLVWRVLRAKTERPRELYLEIRRVAHAVHEEMQQAASDRTRTSQLKLREVVEALCWLLLRQEVKGRGCQRQPPQGHWWGPTERPMKTPPWPTPSFPPRDVLFPLSLLSAAAYLNLPALAQRLLETGYNPHHHSCLFAPATQLAAQAGHHDMLVLLRRPGRTRSPVTENWVLVGAAIRGDMDTLGFVLEGESLPVMSPSTYWAKYYSSAYDVGERCHARSRAVYMRISEAFCPGAALEPYVWELAHYARLGNLDMVEYLLDYGLPIQPTNGETPLVAACRGGHDHVVQFLLERGADPNHLSAGPYGDYALHLSTTAGSLALTRLLLHHGASSQRLDWHDGFYSALWWAFARENPAVVRLLVEHGATISHDKRLGSSAVEMLHHLRYDSMLAMLRQLFGVQLEPTTLCPVARNEMGWQCWPETNFLRRRAMKRKPRNNNSEP